MHTTISQSQVVVNKSQQLSATSMPMSPTEVARHYLTPWAYDMFSDCVYVDRENVTFLRDRMAACGNPDFPVRARACQRH